MLLPGTHQKQGSIVSTTSETILFDDLTKKPLPTKPSWIEQHIEWRRRRKFSGWRFGLRVAAFTALLILIVNFSLLIWSVAKFHTNDGIGSAFEGDCDQVNSWATWFHVLINITGSLLLAASNYAMQCLAAPTRAECDHAYARADWLDIGILSVRNLFKLSRWRVFLWIVLLLSSIPIHILYNSTVFKTLSTNYYSALIVDNGFLLGKPLQFNFTTASVDYESMINQGTSPGYYMDMQAGYLKAPSDYISMPTDLCITTYATDYVSQYNTVFLVTNTPSQNKSVGTVYSPPLGIPVWSHKLEPGVANRAPAYAWLCEPPPAVCDASILLQQTASFTLLGRHIDHCIAERVPMRCQLNFSSTLLAIVVICNFMKATIMFYVLSSRSTTNPLVILGDAIQSFIDRPEENHNDVVMMTARDAKLKTRLNKIDQSVYLENAKAMSWSPSSKPLRWAKAITPTLWTMISSLWLVSLAAVAFLFWLSINVASSRSNKQYRIGSTFGGIDPSTLIIVGRGMSDSQSIIANILVANSPQLLMSIAYLLYSSCFTSMLLAHEWSSYARTRLPLRVTTPVGKQLSTYWLHLPYMYSIPLLVISAVMHWLISASIFLARITTRQRYFESDSDINSTVGVWSHNSIQPQYNRNSSYVVPHPYPWGSTSDIFYPNHTDPDQKMIDKDIETTSALGFSVTPILCCIIVGVMMYLTLLALALLRRFRSNMPLAMSNSLAIANACHTDEPGSSTKRLQWRKIGEKWTFTATAPPEGDVMDLRSRPWWWRIFVWSRPNG